MKTLNAPPAVRETIDTSLDGLIGAGREIRKEIQEGLKIQATVPGDRDFPDRFHREVRSRLKAERGAGTVESAIGA